MKNLSSTIILSALLTFAFNSCTKEAGIKQDEKLSAADCPRLAGLTAEKKEALFTVTTYAGENDPNLPLEGEIINGVLCKSRFVRPYGITINADGIIYIADEVANIRKIEKGMVSILAGNEDGAFFNVGNNDGVGIAAKFASPTKIVLGKDDYLYMIDQRSNAIRKISMASEVSTFITSYRRERGYQDGPLDQAKFADDISSIAIANDGSIFLYEGNNLIRKISNAGIVSTYAGQPPVNEEIQRGYKDGPKENALFNVISDMTFAPNGFLYFCDARNQKLRRINLEGFVETVADLPALQRITGYYYSIAISDKGVVFITTSTQVFKIDPDGVARSIAGSEISNYKDGVGSKARFTDLHHMAIHKNYLYLTDGSTIRRMNIE